MADSSARNLRAENSRDILGEIALVRERGRWPTFGEALTRVDDYYGLKPLETRIVNIVTGPPQYNEPRSALLLGTRPECWEAILVRDPTQNAYVLWDYRQIQ